MQTHNFIPTDIKVGCIIIKSDCIFTAEHPISTTRNLHVDSLCAWAVHP